MRIPEATCYRILAGVQQLDQERRDKATLSKMGDTLDGIARCYGSTSSGRLC